ncbi:MAG: penicillin-binding protein 1C [Verrucomicrobia bacterium]|nr:MAG: penicillin-binding protein 1C [Verrucomicrobiota bacterium]
MRRLLKRSLIAAASCIAVVGCVWFLLPKPPLLDGISFSQSVRDRNGNLLRLTLASDQKFRIWTPLRDISPELTDATLRYEDKYFARHPGVNPIALLRSGMGLLRGETRTGASTITMQLARLRFHLQTRTPTGKLIQIVRALELERHYSKSEILEAYLNLAPYGRNIEGIGAASEIYFGKTAAHLTRPESISLSVIPQSPTRRALYAGRENRSLNAAQDNWYDRAKVDMQLSARQFSARAETERKFLAPHFVQQVLATEKGRDGIVTTLDLKKQELIERRMADYIRENHNRGIQNAAALLVDVRTRSPGSTLKPFIYALALDQGLIHPLSILADAPRSFGDYNPENFDHEFLGPIRASDALARSRNLPAVELASQLSHPTLYEFLRDAGVALPRSESLYGLALPLGGAEIKMEDLARLYAALSNNGELRPLRRKAGDPMPGHGHQIVTPEAAFLTLEMLNVPRPEINYADSGNVAPVFWKTGTSHGFHDAWSIAVFNHYVLAVWIGNFDGKPNPAFIGRSATAPLLFQIIDSLRASWPERCEPHLPPPGANLKRVEFCAVSGDLPEAHCTHRVEGWFIPGISPIKTCDVHQEVLVDVATGLRVPIDDGTRQLRRDVYEFWPSDLLRLFERAGVARRLPPPFLPGTESDLASRMGNPPRITSPTGGRDILFASSNAIPLRAKTDADVREIYWFADKTFIGKSNVTEMLTWKSTPGDYQLTALDDHGRSASCSVTVR